MSFRSARSWLSTMRCITSIIIVLVGLLPVSIIQARDLSLSDDLILDQSETPWHLPIQPKMAIPAEVDLDSPQSRSATASTSIWTGSPSSSVVISQVYGGGGEIGATFQNDFVELFNRGTTTTVIDGWSIQYASANGTGVFGSKVVSLTGSIAPGQYYLVQMASDGASGALLTPDAIDTRVNLGTTNGKVALVTSSTGLACNGGTTPCDSVQRAQIVDLVGYGNANFYEGGAAAPSIAKDESAFRLGSGCVDTDINGADFSDEKFSGSSPRNMAAPRNAFSPRNHCDSQVVISQIYGGGSRPGAPRYKDFVELFNQGTAPASLDAWSLQFATYTATGSFSDTETVDLHGTLAPGQYYLVQLGPEGASNDVSPVPDAVGAKDLGTADGKIALVRSRRRLNCNGNTTPCTTNQMSHIVDLVGYGRALFFEGSAAALAPSATKAIFRAGGGCVDTNDNRADFSSAVLAPRNMSSPLNPCVVPPTVTPVPTSTSTSTVIPPTASPTNTPTSTPTHTPVPSTNTPTNTPTSTWTPTNTPTSTWTPTNTPTNTPVIFGTLHGAVTNASTGAVLAGANISISGPSTRTTTTNALGQYTVPNLPIGSYTVIASMSGFVAQGASAIAVTQGMTTNYNFALQPAYGLLNGTVINAETGAPLADTTIRFEGPNYVSITTDAHGNYSLILPVGMYSASISALGFFDQQVWVDVILGTSTLNFALQPIVGTLRGTVTNASTGGALAGTTITISGSISRTVITDSQGRYSLVLPIGIYAMHISMLGFVDRDVSGIEVSQDTTIRDVILFPAVGTLSGTVTNAATGEALAGATISVSGASNRTTMTNANGHYSFANLPIGTYTVIASLPEFLDQAANEVVVSYGATTTINFALQSAIGTLIIRAYIDGQSRLVIQGNTIHWYHLGRAAPGRWRGANEPTYVDGMPWYPEWPSDSENRDCYCNSSSYIGIPTLAAQSQNVTMFVSIARNDPRILQQPDQSNDYTLIIDFDDSPNGAAWYAIMLTYLTTNVGTLSGTAINGATGGPLADVTINVSGPVNQSTTTNINGQYSLTLPVGVYTMTASRPGFVTWTGSITINTNEITDISGPLQRATGTLSGSVTSAATGVSLAGATISVSGEASQITTTDSSGYYSLTLPVGNYTVIATKDGFIAQTISEIMVHQDTSTIQSFTLSSPSAYGTLTGTVRDQWTVTPIHSADITISGPVFLDTVTDANGYYSFTDIPIGTYTVMVSRPPYENNFATVTINNGTTTTQDFYLGYIWNPPCDYPRPEPQCSILP